MRKLLVPVVRALLVGALAMTAGNLRAPETSAMGRDAPVSAPIARVAAASARVAAGFVERVVFRGYGPARLVRTSGLEPRIARGIAAARITAACVVPHLVDAARAATAALARGRA